jgi:AcrR family transcriptional regulator
MRAQPEACPTRPRPTERDRRRRAYILDAATNIFTAHGRFRVTLRDFAVATGLTQIAIRHQIADLDHLFALTLAKHLDTILAAIGAVPHNRPDLQARRRAEYFRVTRGICNIPTPIHFLWMRERFSLPDDQLEPLEQSIGAIGYMLGGEAWQTALVLLDSPHLDETQIETMLAAHARAAEPEMPAQSAETQAPPLAPNALQNCKAPAETPTARPWVPHLNRPAPITILAATAATHTSPPPLAGSAAAPPFRPPQIGQPPPRAAPAQAA